MHATLGSYPMGTNRDIQRPEQNMKVDGPSSESGLDEDATIALALGGIMTLGVIRALKHRIPILWP